MTPSGGCAGDDIRSTRKSIILHPRQLVGVEIGIAEQFLADPGALHEEADVELVGHAHAAMHLHAFLHRQRRGRAGTRLGDRNRAPACSKLPSSVCNAFNTAARVISISI